MLSTLNFWLPRNKHELALNVRQATALVLAKYQITLFSMGISFPIVSFPVLLPSVFLC